jgi:putative endonuclease
MTDGRRSLGRAAEHEAAALLARRGLRVIARNVRFADGEIDLVCRDHDVLVFVEVKCRRAGWDDAPGAAVSRPKQRRLIRLAQRYLQRYRLAHARCRFDVVAVTVTSAGALLARHLVSAFDAS